MAPLFHVSGFHNKCPKTADTWCLYQRDKLEGTNLYYDKHSLPIDIRKSILPVYNVLCHPDMLPNCLHGKTQNANESFNGMIWNRVPKNVHVGLPVFSLGVYDAIAHCNYGDQATLDTLKSLNIEPGIYTTQGLTLLIEKESEVLCIEPKRVRRKEEKLFVKKESENSITILNLRVKLMKPEASNIFFIVEL